VSPVTVGHFLINEIMPEGYKISKPLTNKGLHDHVVGLAKSDPQQYVKTIMALKRQGDEIATLEGITVGLEDVRPLYGERNKIVSDVARSVAKETDPVKRERLVIDAQTKLLALTKTHPGSMTEMALSGARGSVPQLMKMVATPLASQHPGKGIDPFIIRHSYAEGLSPAEYWVTAPEARANNVATVVSVSQPGEMNKLLVANMTTKIISQADCGTTNGLRMLVDDPHIIDRFLARDQVGMKRNTPITPQLIQHLKVRGPHDLLVRSPMTCLAKNGVCQFCQGHNEKGQLHSIGINVGVRSAQALSEPLTQMALGSKHAVLTIRERTMMPQGLKGVRQILEVPKSFQHEAVLAPEDGIVDRIEVAPQGGHYLTVGRHRLYAETELTPSVHVGQHVESGDVLTNGIPHPQKLVAAKGLGAGRQYLVDILHRIYQGEGVNMDKRHLELLAKSELNHVRMLDHDPEHPELLKGDIINYNAFREAYGKDSTRVPIHDAVGRSLGEDLFHHTVGTKMTSTLVKNLRDQGISEIQVLRRPPRVEFIMKPLAMNPMLGSDWMGRLAHRYLKGGISQAAHIGEEADIHGAHPVPGYAFGAEFRQGPGGTY